MFSRSPLAELNDQRRPQTCARRGTERRCKPCHVLLRRCKRDVPSIPLYEIRRFPVICCRGETRTCFFPARFVAPEQPWAASGRLVWQAGFLAREAHSPSVVDPVPWDGCPRSMAFRPSARGQRAWSIPPGRRDRPGSESAAGSSRCENAASSFGPSVNGSSSSRIRPTVSASRRASSGRLTICRALARR